MLKTKKDSKRLKILSYIKNILAHYRFYEFKNLKNPTYPSSPSAHEKYMFAKSSHKFFIAFSLVSFVSISICTFGFIMHSPLMGILLGYFILTVIYFAVSLSVSAFFKSFDLEKHRSLVEKWGHETGHSIDIFLPTAGESILVLNNTWQGVRDLTKNYKGKISVYCLDDSANEKVRLLAESFGFEYKVRPNRGWFKKAGNLKYGFENSDGEFIVIFDADFRPRHDFLKELLPYFFEDKSLGLVQSPQYFEVSNEKSWLERGAGAVQELFYRLNQVSRQNYNASICVGSNAVYRRAALNTTGGTALIEHSEDVHTGFNMRLKGWGIQYIPIVLAKGLCPDDMKAFFKQQYRWCMGSLSLLSSNKFWSVKINLRTRLAYFAGFLYYIHTGISSFIAPIIPLAVITLYPDQVTIENYLLVLPSFLFVQFIYPAWHKSTYGIEAWSVRTVYGWAHFFAMFDVLTKKAMEWQPTGARVKTDNRYITFRVMQFLFNFIPAVIWTVVSGYHLFVLSNLLFLPLFFAGIYYFLVTSKVTFYNTNPESPVNSDINVSRKAVKFSASFAMLLLIAFGTYGYIFNRQIIEKLFFQNDQTFVKAEEFTVIPVLKEKLTSTDLIDPRAEPNSTFSANIENSDLYKTEIISGDSQYRIYRRVIEDFVLKTKLETDLKQKRKAENYLVKTKPLGRLKIGESVNVSSDDLKQAFAGSSI